MATEEYDQHVEYRQNKFTEFNMDWYDNLRASKSNWTKVSEQRIHQNRGYPVHVKAGHVFKSILPEGSNIIDVWFFGEGIKDTAGEQYDPVLTAALEGFICRKNSRLWSNLPYFRPMATYIDDNIDPAAMPDEHHWPVWHGGHCCPEAIEMGHNKLEHASCHTNALEALITAGYDFETADALACMHNMCIFQPMAVTDQQMPAGHMSPTWHNSPSHLKSGTHVDYQRRGRRRPADGEGVRVGDRHRRRAAPRNAGAAARSRVLPGADDGPDHAPPHARAHVRLGYGVQEDATDAAGHRGSHGRDS